jgi:hypothetical protein
MQLEKIRKKIHEYFLSTEKEGGIQDSRGKGEYPNAILLTEEQYLEILKEMFKLEEEISKETLLQVKILSIEGLEVVFTDWIQEPKVMRISK